MIPVEQIARLAELYDRYNNAFDPASQDCRQAGKDFKSILSTLHATHAAEIDFNEFRLEVVRICREYLRKNKPL